NNGSSHGTINVTGSGSSFSSNGLGIGSAGQGTFLLSDGATATTSSASIGLNAGATGEATVEGEGTSWSVTTHNMIVGQADQGTLQVADGAVVTIEHGALKIGSAATGVGHVEIKGTGSRVSSQDGFMAIGNNGQG